MIGDPITLDGRPHAVTFESVVDYGRDEQGRRLAFTVVRAQPVSLEEGAEDGAGPGPGR